MSDEQISAVLDKMTYGVYVVTARKRQEVGALTASWVCQVSREPADECPICGAEKEMF